MYINKGPAGRHGSGAWQPPEADQGVRQAGAAVGESSERAGQVQQGGSGGDEHVGHVVLGQGAR